MRLVEFKIISVFSKQTTVIFTLSQKNIGLVTSITLNELHPIKFLVVQGVLMPLVGAVGLAGNVLSVAVLSGKEMSNSFNKLLIALTIFDTTLIVFMVIDYSAFRGHLWTKLISSTPPLPDVYPTIFNSGPLLVANSNVSNGYTNIYKCIHKYTNTYNYIQSLMSSLDIQSENSWAAFLIPVSSLAMAVRPRVSPLCLRLPQVPFPLQQHHPLLLHLHHSWHRLRKVTNTYNIIINNISSNKTVSLYYINSLREVVKKSKWKFKMAFAMKGGGSRVPHTYFEKWFLLKTI